MKEIYPKFATEVEFIAVDIGYSRDLDELRTFVRMGKYPWKVGLSNREMLLAFGVFVQSTKVAIDSDGIIIYKAGYGEGTDKEWIKVFEKLSG